MSMTEQELSDVISAVIEARMLVPWQDAEPAAKALATMVKQYIERHLAAGQQGADREYPEAAEVCGEAYQVVGSLLSDLGIFETERARKILDNLSQHRMVHRDVLPWESCELDRPINSAAISSGLTPEHPDAIRLDYCAPGIAKPAGAVPDPLDAAIAKGTKAWTGVPDSFVEDLRGEGAGRADAMPAWFGELPAPISNPEAWPANYAGGYNDALNMCYDVIRGHALQPMTTQGEAVENVDHFSSLREAVLAFDENPNGQNSTAVIMRARRLTGSQP